MTKLSCFQIQDKIKHLEEKLCKEEHHYKLIQGKAAQVDWNSVICSHFLLLQKAILSVQDTFLITFKLCMFKS